MLRNPIRPKNLSLRFLPLYGLGLAILIWLPLDPGRLLVALPWLVVGLGLRGWGAGYLVKNHVLSLGGPYAHVRHPLYLGTLLIATGLALGLGGWVSLALLAGVWPWFALIYFPRKERVESARLEALYGARFARYREAVPALIPRLRAYREMGPGSEVHPPEPNWEIARYSDNNELGAMLAVVLGWVAFYWRASA